MLKRKQQHTYYTNIYTYIYILVPDENFNNLHISLQTYDST